MSQAQGVTQFVEGYIEEAGACNGKCVRLMEETQAENAQEEDEAKTAGAAGGAATQLT